MKHVVSNGRITRLKSKEHSYWSAKGTVVKNCMSNWTIYKKMLTIFFWRRISGISLAVRNNKILITCYVYVVRVAVRVPQQVIFKWCDQFTSKVPNCYRSIPESQEQLQLIQKNKGRWSHKLSPADFYQLEIPYLHTLGTQVNPKLKPKLRNKYAFVSLH